MTPIHQLIVKERKRAGLSQSEMAKRLKMHRETYIYWEKSTPSLAKIRRVERALNLPDGHFLKASSGEEITRHDNLDGKVSVPESTDTETKALLLLAQSNKDLAEATRVLARNQEEIIRRVKASAGYEEGISATLKERFSNLYELIAQLGTGLRWNSMEEATEALNKYAIVHD